MTIPDVLRLIETQTSGTVQVKRLCSRALLLSDLQLGDLCVY